MVVAREAERVFLSHSRESKNKKNGWFCTGTHTQRPALPSHHAAKMRQATLIAGAFMC
jgi:hypothetical protein